MDLDNINEGDLIVTLNGAVGRIIRISEQSIVTEFTGGICHIHMLDGVCTEVGLNGLDIAKKYDLNGWMDDLDHKYMNRLLDCEVNTIAYSTVSGVWVGHQKTPWNTEDWEREGEGEVVTMFPIPSECMPPMYQDVNISINAIITILQNRARK